MRRRITRPKDFHKEAGPGKETSMHRLCIEVLEREMLGSPRNGSMPEVVLAACDLRMTLLLLENKVALARYLFPVEARLAMHIAHADSTLEFPGLSTSTGSLSGNLRDTNAYEMSADQSLLEQSLLALIKAVEASLQFFPNCLDFVDKLLEDDALGDLLGKGSPEEQRMKRVRYMELNRDLIKINAGLPSPGQHP